MGRFAIALGWLLAATVGVGADAEEAKSRRPFDAFSGVVFACLPALDARWTLAACDDLAAEMTRRAREANVRLVTLSQGETDFEKAGNAAGIDGAKAIQTVLQFRTFGHQHNRITLELMSHWIWRPTEKEIPGLAPGQQFAKNFFSTSVESVENVTSEQFAPYQRKMLEMFFDYGEGKQ
jgi:hypothetical protein